MSLPLYRIANWSNLYENNRTRELKALTWVPFPNRHDGDGYTTLMSMENAESLLGAFMVIVQVASKCDPRGTLLRDGARPHTATSLARITRFSEATIERCLKVCSDPEIGWIICEKPNESKETAQPCDNPAPKCDNPASPCLEGKGMEGKEGKGMEGNQPAPDEAVIPTLKEIQDYCSVGLGIPPDYCEHYHNRRTVSNGWLKNGQLIQWRIDISHWWKSDRATWNQRRKKSGVPESNQIEEKINVKLL